MPRGLGCGGAARKAERDRTIQLMEDPRALLRIMPVSGAVVSRGIGVFCSTHPAATMRATFNGARVQSPMAPMPEARLGGERGGRTQGVERKNWYSGSDGVSAG